MSQPENTYIGADLHKKTVYVTVMDQDGTVTTQTEIENKHEMIEQFFSNQTKAKIAVESTMNWIPFYEQLERLGCSVVLSNPLQTKAIAAARIKNDKVDSKVLADLLRTNFLPTAYIQPREIRDLKELVRQRATYVTLRTRIKNRIHSVLFKTGTTHSFSNLYGVKGMEFLKSLELRDLYRDELDQYIKTLELLDEQINELSKEIEQMAETDYDCRLLMTIPGISFYTALMIKSEIGDIARFSSAKKLCSYAGLIPSTYASGGTVRTGKITKCGSRWLRHAFVSAITSGIRNENQLSVGYWKLKKNKGTGKAKVAMARKLATIVFAILTDKQPFREFTPVKQR